MSTYAYKITVTTPALRLAVLNQHGAEGWDYVEQAQYEELGEWRVRVLFKKTIPARQVFSNPLLGVGYGRAVADKIAGDVYARFLGIPEDTKIPVLPLCESVNMIIFCPYCKNQHIDKPTPETGWLNPPHKSHLCAHCHAVFRLTDVPTNGVESIITMGQNDRVPPLPKARDTSVHKVWCQAFKTWGNIPCGACDHKCAKGPPDPFAQPGPEDYETWLLKGKELHREHMGSNLGLLLWQEWSAQAANYDRNAVVAMWDAFGPGANARPHGANPGKPCKYCGGVIPFRK